jgi:hypothetical protein
MMNNLVYYDRAFQGTGKLLVCFNMSVIQHQGGWIVDLDRCLSYNIQSISRQGRIQEKKNLRIENVTSIVVIQVQSNWMTGTDGRVIEDEITHRQEYQIIRREWSCRSAARGLVWRTGHGQGLSGVPSRPCFLHVSLGISSALLRHSEWSTALKSLTVTAM